jgi:hypothetical protein
MSALPPAAVRRGRGTFSQTLRAEAQPQALAPILAAPPAAPAAADTNRFASLQTRTTPPPEPEATEQVHDTAREQLFRKDRRKRHILFVGDAQEIAERGFLRLYVHRGPKPLRLHHTPLRLLHLALPHIPNADVPPFDGANTTRGVHALSVGSAALSTHKSNCLICSQFDDVRVFLQQQVLEIWSLDDVAPQRVSLRIELGTAFLTAPNRRPVSEDNFERLISRLNTDQCQLHFATDVPVTVLRAVDAVCGQDVAAKFALIKMVFFSSDKQSRVTARAMWRNDHEAFELLDFEGIGITFGWTILPLRLAHPFSDRCKKDIAFPFDVQLRAYHRSKQILDHPTIPLVNAVLRELTEAQHNQAQHGGSRYDSLDFSTVFELNAKSSDYALESVMIEHTQQRRFKELLVDSTESVLLEGFTAAQGGRSNIGTFLMRQMEQLPEQAQEIAPTTQRCSVARFSNGTVHWKMRHDATHEDNVKPLAAALDLASSIVAKTNELLIDAASADAPEGL